MLNFYLLRFQNLLELTIGIPKARLHPLVPKEGVRHTDVLKRYASGIVILILLYFILLYFVLFYSISIFCIFLSSLLNCSISSSILHAFHFFSFWISCFLLLLFIYHIVKSIFLMAK